MIGKHTANKLIPIFYSVMINCDQTGGLNSPSCDDTNTVAQHGRLLVNGPTLFVNINAYYKQRQTQVICV